MLRTLWIRAIIESIPIAGNPSAWKEIESELRAKGIVANDDRLLDYQEERDFIRMGGESYGATFTVRVEGKSGATTRTVYAKAIIGGFGEEATAMVVRAQVERLRLLETWGIRTPHVYGCGKGTIYEEFISGKVPEPAHYPDLEDLARIAAILDCRGARPLNFLADLLEDGGGELRYVDAGCDLGHIEDGMVPRLERPALSTLLAAAGERAAEAVSAYERQYQRVKAEPTQGGGQ